MDKITDDVAIHEAGHVIVGEASGIGKVKVLRSVMRGGGWIILTVAALWASTWLIAAFNFFVLGIAFAVASI